MRMTRVLALAGFAGALALPVGVLAAEESGKGMMGHERSTEARESKGAHSGMYILGADKLEGMTVRSQDNKDVGTINKILLNTENGRIEYVVVSSGGVLGVGDRKFVVPWQSVSVKKAGDKWEGFVAKMDAEKLRTAPEYRPEMTDEYQYSIWNWYGLRPRERRG